MRVSNIRLDDTNSSPGRVRVAADITCDDPSLEAETLWIEVPDILREDIRLNGDPWLAALLPLASRLGEPLHIDATVDSALFDTHLELQEWWKFWFPDMKPISVHPAALESVEPRNGGRTAQFFSGGVDSFFTLLRHLDPENPVQVDDLLIGWGFDIPISDAPSFERVKSSLEGAASKLQKRLIPFSTNFRETRFGQIPWGSIGHGNAMASVALLLEGTYGRVLVPSTDGYRETAAWGSHPAIDHLFSSSSMRIIHDGAAHTRLQKVAMAATSPVALDTLRVCWRSQSDKNCGECEKCLRTMLGLELCEALNQATSFAHASLDMGRVSRIYCPHTEDGPLRLYYEEMRDFARARGRPEISRAISYALTRSLLFQPLKYVSYRLMVSRYTRRLGKFLECRLNRLLVA